MSLHHGLTDLCGNHFTDSFILPWFQASSQASLRFRLRAKLLNNFQQQKLLQQSAHRFLQVVQQVVNYFVGWVSV